MAAFVLRKSGGSRLRSGDALRGTSGAVASSVTLTPAVAVSSAVAVAARPVVALTPAVAVSSAVAVAARPVVALTPAVAVSSAVALGLPVPGAVTLTPAVISISAKALGPAVPTLTWKGDTWTRDQFASSDPFMNDFGSANVFVDGSGFLNLVLTNDGGGKSHGAQAASTTTGRGYGRYFWQADGQISGMHPNIVFGGLFTYDSDPAQGNTEIDSGEQSAWSGATGPWRLGHVLFQADTPNRGSWNAARDGLGNELSTLTDATQTTELIWLKDKMIFRIYHGLTIDPAQLYRESIINAGDPILINGVTKPAVIPTPRTERVHLNLWVCPNWSGTSDPATVTDFTVKIRDFAFTAASSVTLTPAVVSTSAPALGAGAPAPTIRSTSGPVSGTAITTAALALPAGTVVDDVLVISVVQGGGQAIASTSNGATQRGRTVLTANVAAHTVYTKKIVAADITAASFTVTFAASQIYEVSAVSVQNAGDFDVISLADQSATALSSFDVPSVAPTAGGELEIGIVAGRVNATTTDTAITWPAPWTKIFDAMGTGATQRPMTSWATAPLGAGTAGVVQGPETVTSSAAMTHANYRVMVSKVGAVAASSVTLTPAVASSSAAALAGNPGPTAVTLTPAVVAATSTPFAATAGPTSVALAPAVATSSAVALATVSPSLVTLTPAVVAATAIPAALALVPIVRALSPATVATSAQAISGTPGPVTLALTPAGSVAQAVPLGAGSAPTSVTLTPAVLTSAGVAVASTPGPVTLALTPAGSVALAVALGAGSAPVTVTLTPAVLTSAGVAVASTPGPTSVTLSPSVVSALAVALGAGSAPVAVTLTAAQLASSARPLVGTPGPVTVALTPVGSTSAAVALGVAAAPTSVTLAPAGVSASAVSVVSTSGPTLVVLTPAVLVTSAVVGVLTPRVILTPAGVSVSARTVVATPRVILTPAGVSVSAPAVVAAVPPPFTVGRLSTSERKASIQTGQRTGSLITSTTRAGGPA